MDADALLTLSPNNRRVMLLSGSFWVWNLPAELRGRRNRLTRRQTTIPTGYLPAFPFFTQFNTNGEGLFSALHDGRLYEVPLARPFAAVTGPSLTASPALMAASSDMTWIGAASSDQRLLVWPEGSSEMQITSEKYRRNLSALTFSHDGTLAASSDGQGKLNIWDVEAGAVLNTLAVPAGVSALTFSAG